MGDEKRDEGAGGTRASSGERDVRGEERAQSDLVGAVGSVGSIFTQGVDAVKEMSSAHRALAEAREQLEELDRRIAGADEQLRHRRDVAARYKGIIAEETARRDGAIRRLGETASQKDAIGRKVDELKASLEQARSADAVTERRLKAALDAAEAKEASARESGARLQRRLDDARAALARAEPEREKGVAAARRAIDSAASRLKTLRAERAEVDRNPSVNSATYSVRLRELDAEIADATNELAGATEKLPQITSELKSALIAAKATAQEAEKPIEQARYAFRRITDEADTARDAYEEAKREAAERQRGIREQISAQERSARAQDQRAADAQDEADAAQALIDEANEIHAHPEITESVASQLGEDRGARELQAGRVATLADTERDVRERTRTSRVRFIATIAGIIAAVIALALIAWLVIGR